MLFSAAVLLLVLSALQESVTPPALKATDRPNEPAISFCGVSFKVPDGWIISPPQKQPRSPLEQSCMLGLEAKDHDRLVGRDQPPHFWTIGVEVVKQSFDEILEVYDIRREGDRWLIDRGAEEQPATEIKGLNWRGLRVDHYSPDSPPLANHESEFVFVFISSTTSKATTAQIHVAFGPDDQRFPCC